MNIYARKNDGFAWHTKDGVHFKGYFFDSNDAYFSGESACTFFLSCNKEELRSLLASLNGSFCVILNCKEIKIFAVDRLRSMPLFYSADEHGQIMVSDDADFLCASRSHVTTNARSIDEFLLTGFVIGSSTLVNEVRQVRAGEYIKVKDNSIQSSFYYIHLEKIKEFSSVEQEFDRLHSISERWCDRLLKSIGDRQIVIPLSGGYDSRYIAAYLHKKASSQIITYTYGVVGSPEVSRSEQVARELGLTWFFVEYTADNFKEFVLSESHNKYIEFAHQSSSLPHYQEFIAIKELLSLGVLDSDAVFVPGFCGDFLGGSYVPLEAKIGKEKRLLKKGVLRHILEKQLYLKVSLGDSVSPQVTEHIIDELKIFTSKNLSELNAQEIVSVNDAFFAQHKISKYVVNSLRVYEYFGFEWRMPLWDSDLIEYWYSLPYRYRAEKPLYESFLVERVFTPLNIGFARPRSGGLAKLESTFMRANFPISVLSISSLLAIRLLSVLRKREPTGFDVPSNIYRQHLNAISPGVIPVTNNFVAVFARWLILKLYRKDGKFLPVGK